MVVLWKSVAIIIFCVCLSANAFRTAVCPPSQPKGQHSLSVFTKSAALSPRNNLLARKQQLIAPFHSSRRMFGLETRSEPNLSLKNVVENFMAAFQRFFQKAKEYLSQVEKKDEKFVRKVTYVEPDLTTTTFLSAPSKPINKVLNVQSGREYAEAKLQEIDSYFKRVTQPLKDAVTSSVTSPELKSAKDSVTQKAKQQGVYDRKLSVLDLTDEQLAGKRVLVRCDLDVPLQDGAITDDSLLERSLPTIQHLASKGAKVVIAAHLGQPAGTGYEKQYSMASVAERLSTLLGQAVTLIPDCVGVSVGRGVSEMSPGDVVLLENLRYYAGEKSNDEEFARSLAAQADVFVNDAVDLVHLAHASTSGVARVLPVAVSGLALKNELDFLQQAVQVPARPFVAVISGDQLAPEVAFFETLLHKADKVVVGGKMAAAFLLARGATSGGIDGGAVAMDAEQVSAAQRLDRVAAARSVSILLQSDETLQSSFSDAKTVLWASTDASVCADSDAVARAMASISGHGAVNVVAGASVASVVKEAGLVGKMSHISANSDKTFEFLKGAILPGVAALNNF